MRRVGRNAIDSGWLDEKIRKPHRPRFAGLCGEIWAGKWMKN